MANDRRDDTGDKKESTGTQRASRETKSQAAHLDEALDEALRATFPASDPIAISFDPAPKPLAPGSPRRRSGKAGVQQR